MLSPARDGHAARVADIILCNASRQTLAPHRAIKRSVTLQNPVCISPTLTRRMTFRKPVFVLSAELQSQLPFNVGMRCTPERLFRIYQVPRKQIQNEVKDETKKGIVVKRGADLLIFCVQKQARESLEVKSQWEHFNLTYGGDLSPQIVVILGAGDQRSAEEWWNDVVGVANPGGASVAYLPTNSMSMAETEAASDSLRNLINTRCIDCSKTNFAGRQHIFRRATVPLVSEKRFPFSWISSLARKNSAPLPAHQDILAESGVWEQISPA